MDSPKTAYLTIDAGGSFFKSAILNKEGEIYPGSYQMVPSISNGTKDEILDSYREIIKRGLQFITRENAVLKGISIASPGPFNIYTAQPLMKHKFKAIYGLDLRDTLRQQCAIPNNIQIRFIHDANAVLEGEIMTGNARGYSNVALVTLGTGLGFAVSKNRKVLCNEIGGPRISIYKIPYKNGILEDYTAKRGFLKAYRKISGRTDIKNIEVSDIGKWAAEGDKTSILCFKKVGQILAVSIHKILAKQNIQCLLFSGQISKSFQFMEQTIQQELQDIQCLEKISVVKSIDKSALYGAYANFLTNKENS